MTPAERKDYNKAYKLKNKKILSQKNSEYNKEYRKKNSDYMKKYLKKYKEDNKESIASYSKVYQKKNKEKLKKYQKEYLKTYVRNVTQEYKAKKKKYNQTQRKINPLFKLNESIRRTIKNSFRYLNSTKHKKSHDILGCTTQEFKIHLESKFEPWMTWENYGKYNGQLKFGWDIDHIIPLATAKTEKDIIQLNHYTNLQPLCSKINRDIKKDNI